MKQWHLLLAGLTCLLLFASCRKSKDIATEREGPPQVGATYSLNDGEGGFRSAKVVAVEDEVVFVRLFAERWSARPSLAQLHKTSKSTGVAYSPQSFSGMQPLRLENGSVSPDELETYEAWKKGKRDIF